MILDEIISHTRQRVKKLSVAEIAEYQPRSLAAAITASGDRNAIIAEIKYRSPSSGTLPERSPPAAIAETYIRSGCCAISVLTEPVFFGGSPETLKMVRAAAEVPILRKDFVIDEVQLLETGQLQADAVLLITGVLGSRTAEFVDMAQALSLEPLVEVHEEAELDLALAAGAGIVGINNRNLKTMEVDMATTLRIGPLARECGAIVVSESGIRTPGDVAALKDSCDAFLIGTSLMSAPDNGALLEAFVCA
jgi:indole-3-glycerol phosphate synthase